MILSPIRYTRQTFRAGGTQGSIFSLVAATIGSGIVTFPYAIASNGVVFGTFLIVLGAVVSYFSGMLLVAVSTITKADRYEDMARTLYNKKVERLVSVLNIICLMGFCMSFLVFVKQTVPSFIEQCGAKLPEWCDQSQFGQAFWAVLAAFGVFPLSTPRSIGALRYVSLAGTLFATYLCFAVMFSFFLDRRTVPDIQAAWDRARMFNVSFKGVVTSMPMILFAYMFQVNIPQIFKELERRNYKNMSKVVYAGTSLTVTLYTMIGVFGYLSFNLNPDVDLKDQNILLSPWKKNIPILIGNFAVLFATIAAIPLCVLPCKDSIEEIRYKDGMTKNQNLIVTFCIIFASMLLALVIPGIGYAMTFAGCTTNPAIGFFVPIIFYHKATP